VCSKPSAYSNSYRAENSSELHSTYIGNNRSCISTEYHISSKLNSILSRYEFNTDMETFSVRSDQPTTPYCSACQLIFASASSVSAWSALPPSTHHDSLANFRAAVAKGCYICVRVEELLLEEASLYEHLNAFDLSGQKFYTTHSIRAGWTESFCSLSIEIHITQTELAMKRFRLFSSDGEDFVTTFFSQHRLTLCSVQHGSTPA
jgi:hypothetical protein